MLLARCAPNTTLPDWDNKTDYPGRVYNQTGDIILTSGTTTYACSSWKEYK
jgi:hypothetical protein